MPTSHVYAGRSPDHGSAHLYSLGGLGILGALVPTTGDGGRGGLLANDVAANNWQDVEVRVFIQSSTFPALFVYDDSSWRADGLADAVYTAVQKVYAAGVFEGTSTLEANVGGEQVFIRVTALDIGDDVFSAAATVTAPAPASVTVTMQAQDTGDDLFNAVAIVFDENATIEAPPIARVLIGPTPRHIGGRLLYPDEDITA